MKRRRRDRKPRPRTYSQASVCPWCGKTNELGTKIQGGAGGPQPGSLSICIGCGEIGVFGPAPDLALRRPTEAEQFAWSMDPEFRQASRARVLLRMHADLGAFPHAVFGPDGPIDLADLDDLIRPKGRGKGV